MNDQLVVKAGGEVLPFEEKIAGNIIENLASKLETLIWGATQATDGWDGFLAKFDADSSVIDVAKGASEYETALNVYKAIPANVLKKAEIFVGQDTFRASSRFVSARR